MSDYTPTLAQIRAAYVWPFGATEFQSAVLSQSFDRWLAAHDAEVYQRGELAALVRAFGVLRAHEFMVRSILTQMEDTDYDAISNRIIEYLIHAVDMDAENVALARGAAQ